jgi:hypothetical protein
VVLYSTGPRGRHQFVRLSVQSAYLTSTRKLYAEIKIDRSLEHPHRHIQECFEDSANFHMNLELCGSGSLMESSSAVVVESPGKRKKSICGTTNYNAAEVLLDFECTNQSIKVV